VSLVLRSDTVGKMKVRGDNKNLLSPRFLGEDLGAWLDGGMPSAHGLSGGNGHQPQKTGPRRSEIMDRPKTAGERDVERRIAEYEALHGPLGE
jgi:hypothetical protein